MIIKLDEQNWQKVTVVPIDNNISSTTMKIKDEQLTSTIIRTTQETTTLQTSTFIEKRKIVSILSYR